MMQRILVTGGAGFIGSHTVDLLLKSGYEVVVLDNLSSGKITHLDLQHDNLEFIEGDILEFPYLMELIASCHAVLHLAAIASVPLSLSNPIYTFQVNTQGFLHVIEAIRQLHKPIRLVYASSAAVYGNATTLPCDDTNQLRMGASPYALQKMHDEDYANLYRQLHHISSLGLRYFNVYGKRQDPHSPYSGVISRFLKAYEENAVFTIFGDGQQSRDFIAVEDVARANCLALKSDCQGVVNIATGKPETLLNLIQYAEKIGKKPAKLQFTEERMGDIRASFGKTELAEHMLHFRAETDLETGLEHLFSTS